MKNLNKTFLSGTILTLSSFCTSAHAQIFNIQDASGTGSHPSFSPLLAIDGDTNFGSRWAGNGSPESLVLDLGSEQRLDDAQIAWHLGDRRSYAFGIDARLELTDGWTTIFSGSSSGATNDFENYNVNDITARYVRIRGNSNSDGTPWTGIREVTISGTGGRIEPDAPTLSVQSPLPEDVIYYDITSAEGEGTLQALPESLAIDGDASFGSRWAGNGFPEELRLNLEANQDIRDVQIAWHLGDRRSYVFDIDARLNSTDEWTTIFNGESSGETTDFENYNVTDIAASELRIRGLSNSDGTPWTGITEVTVSGPALSVQTPLTENIEYFDILSAIGTGSHPLLPEFLAIDGDTSFESRWAGNASPEDLNLSLVAAQDVTDVQIDWHLGDRRSYTFAIDARSDSTGEWTTIFNGKSSGETNAFENYNVANITTSELRIRGLSNSDGSPWTGITEVTIGGIQGGINFGLDPNAEPWENFDLQDWVIDTPAFANDGESQRFGENDWDDITDASREFFFTHTDGGMRFVSTVGGARTSENTSFVRSELREMLRRGDRSIRTQGVNGNNWALGYQPGGSNHGGRNGELKATLRVNEVTRTGDGLHPGRTIIGQIHADNDEPARLYYKKLPNAEFGCIYVSHEIRESDDIDFNLIGDEQCRNNGPANGIRLDELFSYEITNEGADIDVVIRRGDQDGPVIAKTTIDMDALFSGYDRVDEWMYFKAGAYTQNNTGDPDDRDIITFYRLSNTHD